MRSRWCELQQPQRINILLAAVPLLVASMLMGHTLSIIVWGAIPALPSFLFNLTLPLMIGLPGVALLAQGRTRVWCMVGSIGCALVGLLLIVGLVAAVPLGRTSTSNQDDQRPQHLRERLWLRRSRDFGQVTGSCSYVMFFIGCAATLAIAHPCHTDRS